MKVNEVDFQQNDSVKYIEVKIVVSIERPTLRIKVHHKCMVKLAAAI